MKHHQDFLPGIFDDPPSSANDAHCEANVTPAVQPLPAPSAALKRCKRCGQRKPRADYAVKRDRGSPRLQSYCRACAVEMNREYREAGGERLRRRTKEGYHRLMDDPDRRERVRERARRYMQAKIADPAYREQLRALRLKKAYGITAEDYDLMLAVQGGGCAVCGKRHGFITRRKTKGRHAVDHCHATGRVRGLLCSGCNGLLAKAGDRPELLRAAADYLEFHQNHPTPFVVPNAPTPSCA